MYRQHKIALGIPAYNEEVLITDTLLSVPEFVDDIVVIDDAASDSTSKKVIEVAKKDSRIRLLKHEQNVGVGGSIIAGYHSAFENGADISAVVGGDNQMLLSELSFFLDPIINNSADYTKGNRFLLPNKTLEIMPKLRLFGNALLSAITKLASGYFKIYDVVDGYTAISKRAYLTINWTKAWTGYGYPMDFLVHLNIAGMRVLDVPRTAVYLEGQRQSQIKSIPYILKVSPLLLKGFFKRLSYKYLLRDFHPLVFFYISGLLSLLLGLVYGCYLIYEQFSGRGVSGPRSILCALFILIGIQSIFFAVTLEILNENRGK